MGSSEKVKERQQNIRKIKTIIRTLPDKPGVYQFLDEKDKVIYIGKAKSLKKRVSSYFSKDTGQSGKTKEEKSRKIALFIASIVGVIV